MYKKIPNNQLAKKSNESAFINDFLYIVSSYLIFLYGSDEK